MSDNIIPINIKAQKLKAKRQNMTPTKVPAKKKTIPAPDLKAMERHIRFVHGTGPFTYQVIVKNDDCAVKPQWKAVLRVRPNVLDQLAAWNAAGAEICIVPNVMDGNGRGKANCVGILWLFADCDAGHNTLESLLALPVKPNFVIQTSAGHLHPYWRVEGCSVQQFKAVQDALASKLGEDPAVSDPSRCMRLAGTLNHKRAVPEQARIVYPAEGRVVRKVLQLADFCAAMDLDLDAPAAANSKAPTDEDADDTDSETTSRAGDSGVLSVERVRKLLARIDPAPHATWRKVGLALHSRWPDDEGYELWTTWSKQCAAKYDDTDQQRTWREFKPNGGITLGTLVHLARGDMEVPGGGEREFADAIVEAAAGKLGYDSKTRTWWRFAGVRWESSRGDHQALKFVRDYVDDLALMLDDRDKVAHLRPVGKMQAAIKQAQLDDRMLIDEQRFDADPYLLGVKNGVIDLRAGVFRAPTAADMLTRCANVEYDPEAQCPQFRAFIKAVCKNRSSLCLYLVRALGYTLTGETKEQLMFMPMGRTQNGKGMLMNTMANLMGDYATSISPMLVMRANSGNPNAPSPALMSVRNARLLICTETQQNKPFDEAFIKQLTGGDKLVGRAGYGEQTEFPVVGKLWMSGNHDPEIAYGADAMWRRIRALPFDAQFLGEAADVDLGAKLAAEAPGILNLLVKHAKLYAKKGLLPCKFVGEATDELRDRLDSVKQWVDTRCRTEADAKMRSGAAHKSYVRFCSTSKRTPLSPSAFKAAMTEKGFGFKHRKDSNYFLGVRLLND